MLEHDFEPLFKLEHMLKDVRHCLDEARALGRPARAGRGRRAALRERRTRRGLGEQRLRGGVEAAEAAAAALMALLRRPGPAAAAVAACAILAWLPALGAGFVSDDFVLLRAAEAVESPVWPFGHNDLGEEPGSGHFYRPLWVLWNAGLLELFGDEPAAFHAGNLLLFALIAIEVLLLARALLPPAGALVAALAFALYPRHGESVAWASGSTDLLAVAIGLGALLCLLAPWPGRRRILAAAALTAAAALAKEAAFLLPVLGVLLLFARGERSRSRPARGPGRDGRRARGRVRGAHRRARRPRRVRGRLRSAPDGWPGARSPMRWRRVSPSQLELLRYPGPAGGAARAGGRARLGRLARERARGARSRWPASPGLRSRCCRCSACRST